MKFKVLILAIILITSHIQVSFGEVTSPIPDLLREKVSSKWNGNDWDIRSIVQYAYNSNNQKMQVVTSKPFQDRLIKDSRNSYLYDQNGMVKEVLVESFQNEVWVNRYRYTYDYYDINQTKSVVIEVSDGSNWNYYSKTEYEYNADKQLTSGTTYNYKDNLWINSSSFMLTYSTTMKDKVKEQLDKVWNGDYWSDYRKLTYEYNENQTVKQLLSQLWKTKWWVNEYKNDYFYEEFGRLIETQSSLWQTDSWLLTGKQNVKYDFYGNIKQEISYNYYDGVWENNDKVDYDYSNSTEVSSQEQLDLKFEIYPNPSSEKIIINLNPEIGNDVKVIIVNNSGQVTNEYFLNNVSNFNNAIELNISNLPTGSYSAKILNGNKQMTKQFEIIR